MGNRINSIEKKENFEEWLISMDFKLDELGRELPLEIAAKMDYSPASLSIMEKWLLSKYDSPKAIMQKDKYFLDRVVCYVGETYRKNLGAIWDINLSDDKYLYYGLPVIIPKNKIPECPLTIVTALFDRRKGNFMEEILKTMMEENKTAV